MAVCRRCWYSFESVRESIGVISRAGDVEQSGFPERNAGNGLADFQSLVKAVSTPGLALSGPGKRTDQAQ